MKMSKEAFEILRSAVLPTMRQHPYIRPTGYTENLWRWNCLWATPDIEGQRPEAWVNDRLYKGEGLNDDHIETALRAIAREA